MKGTKKELSAEKVEKKTPTSFSDFLSPDTEFFEDFISSLPKDLDAEIIF